MNKDTKLLAEAYAKILAEAIPESTLDHGDRAHRLEKAGNYISLLKNRGFEQVESSDHLNKFVRRRGVLDKDVITVDKDLAGGFEVTINGEAWKGDLNAFLKHIEKHIK